MRTHACSHLVLHRTGIPIPCFAFVHRPFATRPAPACHASTCLLNTCTSLPPNTHAHTPAHTLSIRADLARLIISCGSPGANPFLHQLRTHLSHHHTLVRAYTRTRVRATVSTYEGRVQKEEVDTVGELPYLWKKLKRQADDVADVLAARQSVLKKRLMRDVRSFCSDVAQFRCARGVRAHAPCAFARDGGRK
eukprot:6184516-Pleurochrysis_carterae.AAC.2